MKLKNKIMELLYDYDFYGLAEMDEPITVYEKEAEVIANFIINHNDIKHALDELAEQIQLVIMLSYPDSIPDISLCRGLSLEIMKYILEEDK